MRTIIRRNAFESMSCCHLRGGALRRCLRLSFFSILLSTMVADTTSKSIEAGRLLAEGEWAKAIAAYDEILRSQPDDTVAQLRRAIALQELGEAGQAASVLESLTKTRPVPQVFYRLARAQARLGRPDQALENLHRAITLGFANSAGIEGEADFAALRDDPRFVTEIAFAKTAARPGQLRPEFRALDFLAGEWEQQSRDGRKVGVTRVTVINDGCALLQIDTNPPNYSAHSIYTIDPSDGKWRQDYFDSRAAAYRYAVIPRGEEVVAQLQPSAGVPMLYRNTLTRISTERLRFLIEGSLDQGATWFIFFDGFWVKSGPSAG